MQDSTTAIAGTKFTAAEDRVPLSQKIGYGLGSFIDMWGHWLYPTIAFQIFGLALHVPPWEIGVAVILNRVFDAISDPFFGWLSDNTRSRWGRRRPFMLAGCFLTGIGLPFLLAVVPGWAPSTYFWFMLGSSAIYLPIVSCFNMPYQSLGNELTPDYHERTSVFSYKNAIQKIPELGLFFFGNFFSMSVWVDADNSNVFERVKSLLTSLDAWKPAADGSNPNTLLGAQVYLSICGLILIVVGFASFALVKERYYKKLIATSQTRISIKETLWQTLQCRPFRIQLGMQLAYNIGLSMVGTLGLAATFYYVCGGDTAAGNGWNFLMGVMGMILGFLGIPFFAFIAHRLGKLRALMCVLGTATAVFIGTWWLYTPKIVWLQVFASGMIAFTGAGFWMLMGSIGADVMDYDELEGGRRREGSFSACGSWINKLGMAVGAGVSFFILGWVGFESDRPEVQPTQAGDYSVTISSTAGEVTSTPVHLAVMPATPEITAPAIVSQPSSIAGAPGQSVALCAGISGSEPLTYQWKKDGKLVASATRSHLVIDKFSASDEGEYVVTASNPAGSITSAPARLSLLPTTISAAPTIVASPVSLSTETGQAATFTVSAIGPADLKYQWYKNGEKLSGKTSPTLTLTTNRQPEYTIFMIRLLLAAIPLIGLSLAMFYLARFPLTPEKMAEIRTQLEARRGKV